MIDPMVVWTISALFLLILPGYIWSYIFFPYRSVDVSVSNDQLQISFVERFIISIGLSIGLLILGFIILNNVYRMTINEYTISLFVCTIVSIGLLGLYFFSNHVIVRWISTIQRICKKVVIR